MVVCGYDREGRKTDALTMASSPPYGSAMCHKEASIWPSPSRRMVLLSSGSRFKKHCKSVGFCLDWDLNLATSTEQVAAPDQVSKITAVIPDLPVDLKTEDAQWLIVCIEIVEAYISLIVGDDPLVVMALICACFRDEELRASAKHWKRTSELREERLESALNAIWDEMVASPFN